MLGLFNRIKNMIKVGYVSYPTDDSDNRQISRIVTHSKQYPTMSIYPYGMAANAPAMSSHALVFNISSNPRNTASICFAQKNRFRGLNEGEVALFNEKSLNSLHLKNDGIVIKNDNGNITLINKGATLTITPDKIISSVPIESPDYTGPSESIAKASKGVDSENSPIIASGVTMNSHVHGGVEGGSGQSGGPI